MSAINWDAEKYDNFARHQRQNGFRLLAENYAKINSAPYPAQALDLGCGTGSTTKLIGHFPNFGTVIGLDIDESLLERGRRWNADGRISFVHGNACDFQTFPPNSEESFDLVTAVATMHWWPDPQQGVVNAFRALKPGGHFVGYTWAGGSKLLDLDFVDSVLLGEEEFSKCAEELKMRLAERRPSAPWVSKNEPDHSEKAAGIVRELFIGAGFRVDKCDHVRRKIPRSKTEARGFYEYMVQAIIKDLKDVDTQKLFGVLVEKYLDSLQPGPGDSLTDELCFVDFCCSKPV